MQHWNKKGFIILDSLICVFITTILCLTCYSISFAASNYADGYRKYVEYSNDNIENVYNNINDCEACTVNESN